MGGGDKVPFVPHPQKHAWGGDMSPCPPPKQGPCLILTIHGHQGNALGPNFGAHSKCSSQLKKGPNWHKTVFARGPEGAQSTHVNCQVTIPLQVLLFGNYMSLTNYNTFSLKGATSPLFYGNCHTSVFLILCEDDIIPFCYDVIIADNARHEFHANL